MTQSSLSPAGTVAFWVLDRSPREQEPAGMLQGCRPAPGSFTGFFVHEEACFNTTTGETSSSVLYHDYSYQQIRISLSQHQLKVSASL